MHPSTLDNFVLKNKLQGAVIDYVRENGFQVLRLRGKSHRTKGDYRHRFSTEELHALALLQQKNYDLDKLLDPAASQEDKNLALHFKNFLHLGFAMPGSVSNIIQPFVPMTMYGKYFTDTQRWRVIP